jgi:hypothetical protein
MPGYQTEEKRERKTTSVGISCIYKNLMLYPLILYQIYEMSEGDVKQKDAFHMSWIHMNMHCNSSIP